MLTTYDRVMRDLRAKLLEAKLGRPAPTDTECVPGLVVALTIKRAKEDGR